MKVQEIVEKLKRELSELNWITESSYRFSELESSFACSDIWIGDQSGKYYLAMTERIMKKILKYVKHNGLDNGRFKQIFNPEEGSVLLDSIDDYILGLIIKGLKDWKEGIDKLRKSDVDEDQLIFIHPDWNIESFKKDFKVIVGNDDGWRLGIMSTKDWDFSNDDLCSELNENSEDCFAIGLMSERYDSLEEVLEDMELTKEYEELKEKYPGVESITEIYDTDFD